MRHAAWVVGFGVIASIGCGSKPAAPTKIDRTVPEPVAPSELPAPPAGLKEPAAPPAESNGKDLGKLAAAELKGLADQAAARRDFKAAAAAEYWAVKAGGGDLYDLACHSIRAKDADAALYWLVQAGTKQGIDLTKLSTNPDFKPVWEDPRYAEQVFPFLVKCSQYFAAHGSPQVVTVTPGPSDKSVPTPVIVFLHRRGSQPADLLEPNTKDLAKTTGLPVLAVSGSVPLGPTRYAWAVDATKDGKRISDALKGQSEKVTISPGKVVLVGFDEGAQ